MKKRRNVTLTLTKCPACERPFYQDVARRDAMIPCGCLSWGRGDSYGKRLTLASVGSR